MLDNFLTKAWQSKNEDELCLLYRKDQQQFLNYLIHPEYPNIESTIRLEFNNLTQIILATQSYQETYLNQLLLFSYQHGNFHAVEMVLDKMSEIQAVPDNIITMLVRSHGYGDSILTNKLLDLEITEEVIDATNQYIAAYGVSQQKQFWHDFSITYRTLSLNRKLKSKVIPTIKKTKI